MKEATRHKLVWGWLRLSLGIAQMLLASVTFALLFILGPHPAIWICFAATCAAVIASLLIYRGRPDLESVRKQGND